MTLNLSLPSLVDAGGGLLFVLTGCGILWIARRSRLGLILGLTAIAFGASFITDNIFVLDADSPLPVAGTGLLYFFAGLGAYAASVDIRTQLSPRARRALVAFWIAELLVTAAFLVSVWNDSRVGVQIEFGRDVGHLEFPLSIGIDILNGGLASLVFACALVPRSRAYSFLAASFGFFIFYIGAASAVYPGPSVMPLAHAMLLVVAAFPLFLGDRDRVARLVALGLWGAALAGCLLILLRGGLYLDYGTFGAARTLGVACLAIAILKDDLLATRLPPLVLRRGPLAAAALALLFIVAQVAQNFFAAEYGLLMGGIVAGCFVFAATPIQRAIEARSGHRASPPRAPSTSGDEEAFRSAVRLAIRGGSLSPTERIHLARVADGLGLTARRAAEIEADVIAETG